MDARNIRILTCGVPRVEGGKVVEAYGLCAGYLKGYAEDVPSGPELFPGDWG